MPGTGSRTAVRHAASAADFIPPRASLSALRAAAARCRGCDLWTCGRTVFGEGPRTAQVMLVGEQPGDQEEKAGHPFVGPSGRVLDAALSAAGIDRDTVYVTNAVKHFKYARGEKSARRIHKKPRVIVALGATAARSLLGAAFRLTQHRGEPVASEFAPTVVATVHPSSVLRAPPAERARAEEAFFADVRAVARLMAASDPQRPAGTRAPRRRGTRRRGLLSR